MVYRDKNVVLSTLPDERHENDMNRANLDAEIALGRGSILRLPIAAGAASRFNSHTDLPEYLKIGKDGAL